MKIVYLLSQIEKTGAEVYAITLAEWFKNHNNDVFLISNSIHTPTRVQFISREIHTSKFWVRWKNIFFLRKFLEANKINIIHCHSRASLRVGYWASLGTSTKMISTVHGRQHYSFSKKIIDIYGKKVIGVCENVLLSLQRDFLMNPKKMCCLPNPIDTEKASINEHPYQNRRLAIISRSSGPKGQRARDLAVNLFNTLLEKFPLWSIDVIGGLVENNDDKTTTTITLLKQKYPERFNILGNVNNLAERYKNFSLVIGSGRVPMESLIRGIPTFSIGEYCCEGLITMQNYPDAKKSNFGDIGHSEIEKPIDYQQINSDILQIIERLEQFNLVPESSDQTAERHQLAIQVRKDYNTDTVAQEIEKVYQSVLVNQS